MVEREYREHPAISQSQLKLLLGPDPSLFNTVREPELYFEEKKHFIIGDAVDCQLTRPIIEFHEKFHVSTLENKPSDTMKSIVNQVFDEAKRLHSTDLSTIGRMQGYFPYIIDACNDHNYQSNWKEETRLAKVLESHEYWDDLKAAEGKVVLSTEENDLISQIVMSLKTNPITSSYFEEGKDIEIRYQVPIFFNYADIDCKALLDMVRIDHKKKTIQPIDIKTMGDQTMYFPKSLRQRRYDIQAAFYTESLLGWEKSDLDGYEILPFKFIVESTTKPGNPLVFKCDYELLQIGHFGRKSIRLKGISDDSLREVYYGKTDEIKGFSQLIEDYKWHMREGFDQNRKVVQTQGEFEINWNGII